MRRFISEFCCSLVVFQSLTPPSLFLFLALLLFFSQRLVTSIVGTLTPAVNIFEAVARAFPPGLSILHLRSLKRCLSSLGAGSMTGAPKLRSVKILEDLEGHRPRGVYSGTFGYVAVDGSTDFAVVIRTLVIRGTGQSPLSALFPPPLSDSSNFILQS